MDDEETAAEQAQRKTWDADRLALARMRSAEGAAAGVPPGRIEHEAEDGDTPIQMPPRFY